MARRSLIKMYNKVLDNVESVQSPSRTYALVPLQHYRTPYEDPDGVSKLEINRTYYDSDTSVRERKKTKSSVSKSESHPYIPPKFHVRRKEELMPNQTPHWSNKHGLEYKQSVKSNFEDSVYVAPKKVIAIGKRRSPRIKRCTKIETGPYITPMFFEPKRYSGTKRNEILVSVENKVPPSLQMWASPRGKREQTLSELNKELNEKHDIQERKPFVYKVAEEPAKEDKKPKPYVYKPRLVTQSRTIADDLYSLSLKRYKRMLEKNRYKEPVNTSLPTYGNEKWKLSVVRKSEKAEMKKPEIKSNRDIYGNESWRNHIKMPRNEPKFEKTKIENSLVKDVLKSRKYVALDEYANDMIKEFTASKEVKPDNWDDIEPVLPSFLSTVTRVEKAKKPEVIEKKVEPKKVEVKKPKSAPVRPKTKARAPSRQKEPEISLFKHFQTRSRILRKQHSLIEKKKGVVRKRVASKAESYYSSKQDEDPETVDERTTAYKPGTLYDIDDDGFKVVANDAAFLQNSNNGDKYNVSSMFGYPNIFIR